MFDGNSFSVLHLLQISVHFDGQFRFFGLQEAVFGLAVLSFVDEHFCLVKQNVSDRGGVVLSGDLKGGVEIPEVFVHVDGFLGLSGLSEVLFSFFVSFFVF